MDDVTKGVIESILSETKKTTRRYKSRTITSSPYTDPYRTYVPDEEARRRMEEAAIRRREEAERREREREREERERRERELREARERLEKERKQKLEEALFKDLSRPASIHPLCDLASETAYLSVHPAKACIILRCMLAEELIRKFHDMDRSKVRWNGIEQVFELHPSIVPTVKLVLKNFFKDVQVIGVPKAVPATKFDQLMAKLDKEDKSKIYRILASKYHPDTPTGNHDIMVLINQVFKEV